ncbi:Methyltransferase-like protein 6-like [Heracleum sosnowskyi]|uniref:Methyltransferase-like protein 6-like n=1 Tax=Heracleum sosnowskyi TaxID=360622 RepID=A0AAD8MK96_9APIA|nr:Methyltransferase-like protein 6-like [Heracleum sosnowskyi]
MVEGLEVDDIDIDHTVVIGMFILQPEYVIQWSEVTIPEKRLRFKTTTDASEVQVIEAMQKIASHIKNPSKVGKASKLAIQLITAGSIKPATSDYFFAILESAMWSQTVCNDPLVRADYHALFSAAQDVTECFNKKQRNQIMAWTIRAVVANDLFTDDSFVFSKASGRIKEAILHLPRATEEEDIEESAALTETEMVDADNQTKEETPSAPSSEDSSKEGFDPFGLDALILKKNDEKARGKKDGAAKYNKEEDDENKRFLKCQREALVLCLEIAAKRYKLPWCQTVIDILVKHAYDNISRFTTKQREAIQKLWASIREQQARRKQGKSVSGKLDVNAFESLQEKYANQKISIRRAVGGGGSRRAAQWLG